jgi:hypothetical protein
MNHFSQVSSCGNKVTEVEAMYVLTGAIKVSEFVLSKVCMHVRSALFWITKHKA